MPQTRPTLRAHETTFEREGDAASVGGSAAGNWMRPGIVASSTGRIDTFPWYIWGAVGQVRRGYIDRYVECERVRQPRGLPNTILEDIRDIYTRDVQLIK
jgi:hypothetical protein